MDYQSKYIQMLQAELKNRQLANERYSLRAFARDLEIEPPRLSMIFSKSKGISFSKAKNIVSKLNWTNEDKETFLNLICAVHDRSKKGRAAAIQRINENLKKSMSSIEKFVEDDFFTQIAEPLHYQIIEALKLKDVSPTCEGLFQVLNYANHEIKDAVERLILLGLVTEDDETLTVNEYVIRTTEKNPSMAIRKHHSLQMKAALGAINHQDIDTRCLSSLTIAVPKEILPEIFEKISEFRQEINEFVMNHENQVKTDIYSLTTQFFKVSKEDK